jgi:hypothetical protein
LKRSISQGGSLIRVSGFILDAAGALRGGGAGEAIAAAGVQAGGNSVLLHHHDHLQALAGEQGFGQYLSLEKMDMTCGAHLHRERKK